MFEQSTDKKLESINTNLTTFLQDLVLFVKELFEKLAHFFKISNVIKQDKPLYSTASDADA
jgi:hypothetical protein